MSVILVAQYTYFLFQASRNILAPALIGPQTRIDRGICEVMLLVSLFPIVPEMVFRLSLIEAGRLSRSYRSRAYRGNDTRSSTVVSEPLGRWALEARYLS